MARQVGRARAIDQREMPQRPRHQAAARQRTHAQRAIDAFEHQVHRTVAGAELELDRRVALEEIRQRRRDEPPRDAARHIDLEPSAHLAARGQELLLDVFHVGHQRAGSLQQHFAVGREADAPRGPVQEARAQLCLELLHRRGNGGARQREPIGRTREAAGFGHAQEHLEKVDAVHACWLDCL
jgi:hypothetical protein